MLTAHLEQAHREPHQAPHHAVAANWPLDPAHDGSAAASSSMVFAFARPISTASSKLLHAHGVPVETRRRTLPGVTYGRTARIEHCGNRSTLHTVDSGQSDLSQLGQLIAG